MPGVFRADFLLPGRDKRMLTKPSDKELLAAISTGDGQAFDTLFDRHWKTLYSFVYSLTRDESHTKDVLQDVFLYVWKNRESLYAEQSFLPYLNAVARNNVLMAFRRDKVRVQGTEVLLGRPARQEEADDRLLLKEVQQSVDQELEKMPANMRACFRLSRFEDKTIREIAAELNLSEQTVRNNISEALQRLRKSVAQGSLVYFSVLVLQALA